MKRPEYWNHNAAYYPWVRRNLKGKKRLLDVGCGSGALMAYLDAPERSITGVDPEEKCVEMAKERAFQGTVRLVPCGLEAFSATEGSFDAVIFAASLHHMEAEAALRKAAGLLNQGGVLLVVGLAKPSGLEDWILEGLRVLPSLAVSRLHRAQSSEELGIPVSYALPPMGEVRSLARRLLPGAKLRQGLHYRYLLKWVKAEGSKPWNMEKRGGKTE